jgi:hypothetical protein
VELNLPEYDTDDAEEKRNLLNLSWATELHEVPLALQVVDF